MNAELARRVEQQRVAMLYGSTVAETALSLLMAAGINIVVWPTIQWEAIHYPLFPRLFGWDLAVLVAQGGLQWLSYAYRHSRTAESNPQSWGMRFAMASAVAGGVWGSAAFVLVDDGESLTLALISACLASRAAVSVLTHGYFPPALHAFAVPIFSLLALSYVMNGMHAGDETNGGNQYGSAALGVMWMAVLGYVLLCVDRQARSIATHIRLHYENEQLVPELKRHNAIAEQARQRAEEASRSKSRFFAAANHDLRQPLHSLGLFATALRNGSTEEHSRKLIDQILQCTESLEQLFDNLLDISRLDAGQVEVKPENLPANAILNRVRSTFATPAHEKGLKLTVRPCKATIATDPTLLFRVLSNFVSNAIRYTDRGGILVSCRRRQQKLLIEVWDTGMGVPPEQHERIFEEFYQLHNPERDRNRGLGLGLATVKRIAQLLNHPLRLRSMPGKGSCFTIEVPLADAARPMSIAATVEQKVPNLLGGKLILVVDDEASVRLGMQSLLESWGCKCVTAIDAAEALQEIAGNAPDFIIADLRLRGELTGIDAIRTLRARLGEAIPAVLISGDTAAEQLRKVSAAGLTMMHKPLKAVRLRALLNHEFAKKGMA